MSKRFTATTMNEELQDRLLSKSKPVKFKRTLGLVASTTIGVGAMMGVGLYVLVGIASAHTGPGLWIAYAVCGFLTLFTVMMFADLSKNLPISGGGYAYAYSQLGSFWGFMVGWHLALGSIFACALYAHGFSIYTASLLPDSFSATWFYKLSGAALVIMLVGAGLRGGGDDRVGRLLTWSNLLILMVLSVVAIPFINVDNFTPMLPNGVSGVGSAISLIYISFFGYQLVANSSEEIREAEKNVPKAMYLSMGIALFFYLMIAVISVAVVDWTELATSDAPLVMVASRALGPMGVWLIGIGGVLASGAALNSTILGQSRQIFSMGRDRLLPAMLGNLHMKSGVPGAALMIGAGAVIFVLAAADLEFIVKSANFSLLFSMLPISFALHRFYAGKKSVPAWKRAIPWAAFLANSALLLTLDGQTLMFGGMLIGVGCAVFLSYSHASEKRGRAGFSVDLAEMNNATGALSFLKQGDRILVPMANPDTLASLLTISNALLPSKGGEIIALKVVTTSGEMSPREVLMHKEETIEALKSVELVTNLAKKHGVSIRPVVRGAKRLAQGIIHAGVEERCRLLVMGWSGAETGQPSALLTEIADDLKIDIVLFHLKKDIAPTRIGVALGGFANLPLMVKVATTLAEDHGGEVNYINVMPEHFERSNLIHARNLQCESIRRHDSLTPWRTELLTSDNPLDALIKKSKELDLLVVGSAQKSSFEQEEIGAFSAMIAELVHCSVIIVRKG